MALVDTNQQLTITIHGLSRPESPGRELVRAETFTSKIEAVLKALREADTLVNKPRHRHSYYIDHLGMGSLEVRLAEMPKSARSRPQASSISAFAECTDAVYRNNLAVAMRYEDLLPSVAEVCSGAGHDFSHMVFSLKGFDQPIRADDFLYNQAESIIKLQDDVIEDRSFRGQSYEAFDGELKEVDFRGDVPRGKLVLTGGGNELDCVFRGLSEFEIKGILNQRGWIEGDAIYDGKTELPSRFEVSQARIYKPSQDLLNWRGKVAPAADEDWSSAFDV